VFDLDVPGRVPAGTRRVEITNEAGDWMTVTEVAFGAKGSSSGEHVLKLKDEWEGESPPYRYDPRRSASPCESEEMHDGDWLWDEYV